MAKMSTELKKFLKKSGIPVRGRYKNIQRRTRLQRRRKARSKRKKRQ